jgi:mannosyltransferase
MRTAWQKAPWTRMEETLADSTEQVRNSKRLSALVLLVVAVVLGAYLRFDRLTLADLDGDEAVAWVAAVAPSLSAVWTIAPRIDPGKLGVYHVLLHGWIRVFGDGLLSMRTLSAGLGTISIVLLFATVREVCLCLADEPGEEVAELAGAFSALIFATNIKMVSASRLVRMYPLMLAFGLLQILFFARAQRYGKTSNYAGLAICTALMVATNVSASFLLLGEGLWLGMLLLAKWAGGRAGGLEIFRPGFAVLAGLGLLSPVLLEGVTGAWSRSVNIFFNWISLRPIAWSYRVLRNSAGNPLLFWVFATLAAWGIWRQWRTARLTSGFLALWMTGPVLAVLGVTYLLHPMEMARYVLIAFVGLFALAAVGAASFQSTIVRMALAALIVFLSIPATYRAITHSSVPDWSKAVALAARQTRPDERFAVIPSYETNTVRYYLPANRRNAVVGLDFGCGSERILLFSDSWWMPAKEAQRATACYPHIVERLRGVEVRSRG